MSVMANRAPETDEDTAPEPGARLREGRASAEWHAWDLGRWWHPTFVVIMVGMIVLALLTGPERWRWPTAALMASVIAIYFVFARPVFTRDRDLPGWRRPLGLVLLFLLPTLPAVILNPALTIALVAIAPVFFMTVGGAYAVPGLAVLLLSPAVLEGLLGERELQAVGVTLLINGAILVYALWFSGWVERIILQSAERFELIEELRRTREEAARLSEEAGAMSERERLARELHDTLAQGFTSIITLTQAVESEMDEDPATARRHLALMRETAAENLAEARAMVAARRAVPVEGDDLDGALTRISERLGRELGIRVSATITGTAEALSSDLQVCLLRTAQEALANVRKHAGADHADVALAYTDVGVSLTVSDDGRGFDTSLRSDGNGLSNMRHRAEAVGGVLDLESAPGGGTTVRLSIPHDDADE
ncbi:sensor histidine kinase [Nocardiopsis sp. MG754419]|uniref:sensor histidine kinase n=1 Tax=Nocardiopsis sp. MG754419 TaxID=2259865 RepID=UPI0020110296|nr:sensor histidine kinase [Nocardiopsis sp. MG754419]